MTLLGGVVKASEASPFGIAADGMRDGGICTFVHGVLRRLVAQPLDRRNKAIAGFRNRFNVFVIARFLIEQLAKGGDIPVQISLFDKTVAPHRFHQLFFGDHLARPFDESKQYAENGRRDRRAVTSFR
jgi:hypothetical protein